MSLKINLNSLKWLFIAIFIASPINCISQTVEIITEKPNELVDRLDGNKDFNELVIKGPISTFDMSSLRRFLSKEDKSYSLDIRKTTIFDYEGNPVNGIPNNFFANFENLIDVKFPNNIKYIGERSFFNTGIRHIDIPSSVDSIFDTAFGQSKLSSINLNDGLKYIGRDIFFMCYPNKLHIPASVDSISGALYPMAELYTGDNISIDKNNKKYELIDFVIYSDNRTRIASFLGCGIHFDIPSTVKEIGDNAFDGSGLTSIVIPESVSHLGKGCFSNSIFLEKVEVRGSSCISEMMFRGCWRLKHVIIGDNIKKIMDESFSLCENLQIINIPKSVTEISGNTFIGSKNLQIINISPQNSNFTSSGSFIFSKDMKKLIIFCGGLSTELNIHEGVETIEKDALNDMQMIEKIILPKSLKKIHSSNLYYNFSYTVNVLSKADIPPLFEEYENLDLSCFRIFVPNGSIGFYKRESGWSDIKNIYGLTEYDLVTSNHAISNNDDVYVKSYGNSLILNTKNVEDINVYDFKGIMIYHCKSNDNETRINLPSGKYIIECGKEKFKISL